MPEKPTIPWLGRLGLWLAVFLLTVSCVENTLKYNNGGTGVAIDFALQLRGLVILPAGSPGAATAFTYQGHLYNQALFSFGPSGKLGDLYVFAGNVDGLEGSKTVPAGFALLKSAAPLRLATGEAPLFTPYNGGLLEMTTVEFTLDRTGEKVAYLFTRKESLANITPGSAVTHVCSSPDKSSYAALTNAMSGSPSATFYTPGLKTNSFVPVTTTTMGTDKVFTHTGGLGQFAEVRFSLSSRTCAVTTPQAEGLEGTSAVSVGTMLTPGSRAGF